VSLPDWQKHSRQPLLGSDYVVVEPNTKITETPSQLDFDLPTKECLLFGPMSKFRIKGTFQRWPSGATKWTNLTSAEATNILLCPNWIDFLFKEVSVYCNTYRVTSSNENRFIVPFLNTYLYAHMDSLSKKMLAPQSCHPALCGPSGSNSAWNKDSTEWTEYAKQAFPGTPIAFDYTPLFLWPIYQAGSYLIDDNVARILPTPGMERFQIRFTFTDSQDLIFRNLLEANKTTKYRFSFSEFNLVLEQARLTSAVSKQFETIRRTLAYPGVTRIQLVENVTAGSTSWKARFQDIFLPEAVFIFALDKTVASGTYKFSTATSETVFEAHNLESIDLSFDGKRFSLREPQMGTFRRDELDSKTMYDHLVFPPFDIRQDPKYITAHNVANGGSNTAYPHIYLPLIAGPNRQRLVPAYDEGACVNRKSDFTIEFKFTEANSPANMVFVIFAIYTDVNLIYDPKKGHFSSPYLQYMN
jgi:hypothetical protein